MDNQHKKIKGYRDLSQDEINTMNEIKDCEAQLLELFAQIPLDQAHLTDTQREESLRCKAIATTNLQQTCMWAVRAVALPNVE